MYFNNLEGNLYKVINNTNLSTFDIEYQELISSKIEKILKKKYKFDEPLMILNPYGTKTCRVNIYFNTNGIGCLSMILMACGLSKSLHKLRCT